MGAKTVIDLSTNAGQIEIEFEYRENQWDNLPWAGVFIYAGDYLCRGRFRQSPAFMGILLRDFEIAPYSKVGIGIKSNPAVQIMVMDDSMYALRVTITAPCKWVHLTRNLTGKSVRMTAHDEGRSQNFMASGTFMGPSQSNPLQLPDSQGAFRVGNMCAGFIEYR